MVEWLVAYAEKNQWISDRVLHLLNVLFINENDMARYFHLYNRFKEKIIGYVMGI